MDPTHYMLTPNNQGFSGPGPFQERWMSYKFGARFTFGINTFYNMEVSDGSLDPEVIFLEEVNTDSWVDAAQAAGMKYCLFTAKNEDGFCNWNTRHSFYNIMNTPFSNDLLEMLADSCYKKGMPLGLYFSLWDSFVSFGEVDQKYADYLESQLEELMTQYGEILEIWFDGANNKQNTGWNLMPREFIHAWRNEGAYRWRMDYLYRKIKEWQPECIVLNHPTNDFIGIPLHPVDARTGINVSTVVVDQKYWEWLGREIYLPWEITINLSGKDGSKFEPGFWYFHDGDNSTAHRLRVQEWLRFVERHRTNLVLNCAITPEGLLRPVDEDLLLHLWEEPMEEAGEDNEGEY
ncbi:MAG: alpha-L-fucosidase [Cyclobacteriaceae bacterium]|nr:alpha-L-fucosidase [Cyclobacteriaceae bacterium]